MSTYENYQHTSSDYDRSRGAQGVEIILGHFLTSVMPLGQQYILDAGCGTGNYLEALAPYIGKLSGVDMNEGMLQKARDKLATAIDNEKIALHQSSILDLPIGDTNVDGVVINQVLHHLGDNDSTGWITHKTLFRELARVCKPGAKVVINLCSRHQLDHGFWYYHLISQALKQMREKHIPLDTLDEIAQETGFTVVEKTVPVSALMQGSEYFNTDGVLNSAWRAGDSMWGLVDEKTLEQVMEKVAQMHDSGGLNDFMRKHDTARPNIGQLTFWCAQRV